jgi:hypothetical protein
MANRSGFDTTVPHISRVYDYWLGGKDNYAADREAAEQAIAANPTVLLGVRANRAFLGRAVRFLAGEAGIRQFLDIGTGIPTADNTHEVAQRVAPESRIVYVDNDPVVLAHARALLTSAPGGATAYVDADLRDVDAVVAAAARTLDLSAPLAIMLVGILHMIPDSDAPHAIVARLVDAMPPGSYLALSHPARDINAAANKDMVGRLNERMPGTPLTFRAHDEITSLFDGLELVEPGVVPINRWRPDPAADPGLGDMAAYCGVGRKPG